MRVAFFDVDHTIIRGSSAPLYVVTGVRQGLFPVYSLFYIPFFFVQLHFGCLDANSRDWHFPLLEGKSRRRLEEVSQACFARMRRIIYPQARSLIEKLKKEGHSVVLATSSLDIIVAPLAEHLEVDAVIATTLEFQGGRATGRFVNGPLLKEKKKATVSEYIRARSVEWQDCTFYSDSIFDISLLESVANPVVVNPDPRLRRQARKRGWPIMKFS